MWIWPRFWGSTDRHNVIRMYMHKIGRRVLKRLKWGCNREGTTLFLEGRVPIKKNCCQSSNGSPNLPSIAATAKSFVSWCTSKIDNDRGNLSQMPFPAHNTFHSSYNSYIRLYSNGLHNTCMSQDECPWNPFKICIQHLRKSCKIIKIHPTSSKITKHPPALLNTMNYHSKIINIKIIQISKKNMFVFFGETIHNRGCAPPCQIQPGHKTTV